MRNLDSFFFKSELTNEIIEGYLDRDNPRSEVLFIMKEPHNENQPDFWFYHVLRRDSNQYGDYMKGNAKRFYQILGSLACVLTGEFDTSDNAKDRALKKCAFINLYPFSGASTVKGKNGVTENGYLRTKDCINDYLVNGEITIEKSDLVIEVAKSRIELISCSKDFGIRFIVTVSDLFWILSRNYHGDLIDKNYLSVKTGKGSKARYRDFCLAELDNGIKILEFWHPSYTRINYENLNEAIMQRINILKTEKLI